MKQIAALLVLGLLAAGSASGQTSHNQPSKPTDVWAPFRPLVGKWTGARTGLGGDATQTVEWKFVLGNQFLQCETKTTSGDDPHADLGLISFDKSRQKFVYRSFLSEGYVNQYVGTVSADGKTIEFETESVENGPPGLRAKEIVSFEGNIVRQECLLASGDKPLQSCVVVTLRKDH